MPDVDLECLHAPDYTFDRGLSGALRALELPIDLFGHQLHPPAVGRNRQVGDFRIERRPLVHQLPELQLGVRIVQQRPMTPMARALHLLGDGGLEVDDGTPIGQQAPILGEDDRAAAGRDYDAVERGQPLDRLPLPLPEPGLAFLFENEGDIDSGPRLDVRIAIVEGESQQARQMAPDGLLSGAHGADEENVGLGEHGRGS